MAKTLPKYLKEELYQKFLEAVHNGPYRDRLVILLMCKLGLRTSEVIHLQIEDIDFNMHTLKVTQGKGHKDRILPLLDDELEMLLKLVIGERKKGVVILNERNNPMSRSGIYYLVQKYNRKSIKLPPKQFHSHTLRHTFAVRYLRNGGNIRVLQKLMGHSDIRTTMIYLDLVPDDLFYDMKKVLDKE